MERSWYKVWPLWAPKTLVVEKPVSEYIREWSRYLPDRIAVSFYGRDITYGELSSMIDRAARGLASLGVEKGDRVAVHMDNSPQFVIAYFAVQRAGAVVVPLNPMFKQAELEHELNDAGVETLIGLSSFYSEVEKVRDATPLKRVILSSLKDFLPHDPVIPLPPEANEERRSFPDTFDFLRLIQESHDQPLCNVTDLKADLALLQYTGGTTGLPKGAMISHYALSSAAVATMHWYRVREDDVFLGVAPFFHVMGQVAQMCTALVCGGRLVTLSRFVPDVVAKAVDHYRCTHWVGATTMVIALLGLDNVRDYNFTSFRCIVTGGAPISVELQKKLNELVPMATIVEGYGLSEVVSQGGACTPLFQYKPGFVGIPQTNNDIKIMDQETGTRELGPNEAGEIVIRAEAMMTGYWNRPEETDKVLRNGWLYTGDTGLMDEEGFVKFLGRTRELIKCSGFSVFPAEVENLLYRHPAVEEAAVIGVHDDYRGESPKAFIILKKGYEGKITEGEMIDWCKENMAAYKRPRFIEFRTHLPKSNAGKLLRRVLVAEEREKSASGNPPEQA